MLPVPSKDFFPKIFKTTPDLLALQAVIDKQALGWKNDILNYLRFFDPVKAPSIILDELIYWIGAEVPNPPTEDAKRKAIANAVANQKNAGIWEGDIKIRIDAITGLDTKLFFNLLSDEMIIVGDGTAPAASYWSAFGADGIDDHLGVTIDGGKGYFGNIYIDFTASITDDQYAQVVDLFTRIFNPAYFVVHLGYVVGDDYNELGVI